MRRTDFTSVFYQFIAADICSLFFSFNFFQLEIIGITDVSPMIWVIHDVVEKYTARIILLIIRNIQVAMSICFCLFNLLITCIQIVMVRPGKMKQIGSRKLISPAL